MEQITEKIKKLIKILLQEKDGNLYFVGLVERNSVENKFDLLVSASWINETNGQKELEFVIKELNDLFSEKSDFIEDIVLFTEDEDFILYLKRENEESSFDLYKKQAIKIWENGHVELIPFLVNFSQHPKELNIKERKKYGEESEKVEEF